MRGAWRKHTVTVRSAIAVSSVPNCCLWGGNRAAYQALRTKTWDVCILCALYNWVKCWCQVMGVFWSSYSKQKISAAAKEELGEIISGGAAALSQTNSVFAINLVPYLSPKLHKIFCTKTSKNNTCMGNVFKLLSSVCFYLHSCFCFLYLLWNIGHARFS